MPIHQIGFACFLVCAFAVGAVATNLDPNEKGALSSSTSPSAVLSNDEVLARSLETIRLKYKLPALGGAIVTSSGLKALAVVGVRKQGDATLATIADQWHLGSDTKAITATLIARLIETGKLKWQTKLGDVFPDIGLDAVKSAITLRELITHRAGLPANARWSEISPSLPLPEQRRAAIAQVARIGLVASPGTKFEYSNWGFVLAGAMAEAVTQTSYEQLLRQNVSGPLHMESVGYGWAGSAGKVDQPWGHRREGSPVQGDNPLVMVPAGGVNCSLEDWSKFVADQLCGAEGKPALLQPASYSDLNTPIAGETYAGGWIVTSRTWAGGKVFTHAGTNTMNMAVVWLAPNRDVAFLVVCNQGDAGKPCDEAIGAVMARWKQDQ